MTPEQQSRDLLEQMGMLFDGSDGPRDPQTMSAGEVVFLANLIADKRRAEAERDALRGALLELRIRLHVSGRRPEECYEMSILDAALVAARKEGGG